MRDSTINPNDEKKLVIRPYAHLENMIYKGYMLFQANLPYMLPNGKQLSLDFRGVSNSRDFFTSSFFSYDTSNKTLELKIDDLKITYIKGNFQEDCQYKPKNKVEAELLVYINQIINNNKEKIFCNENIFSKKIQIITKTSRVLPRSVSNYFKTRLNPSEDFLIGFEKYTITIRQSDWNQYFSKKEAFFYDISPILPSQ